MMDFAANIAIAENKKQNKRPEHKSSKEDELVKTVFYNANKKDEVLALYRKESHTYSSEKISFKEYADSLHKSYKFFEPTY